MFFVRARPWPLVPNLLLWTTTSLAADRKCFNPDSSQATGDIPCTNDDVTFCCNKDDICMSNGLCYLQGTSGLALSRGSCTDMSWSACGSYKYCFDYGQDSGFPIVAGDFEGTKTVHCCGQASYDNGTVTCPLESVSVPVGTAIQGAAALAASSTGTSDSSCPSGAGSDSGANDSSSSRETAIAAGIGVPLGVIAIASLIWAFWERQTRVKALAQAKSLEVYQNTAQPHQNMSYPVPPAETQAPLVELGGSLRAAELDNEGCQKPSGHP